MTSRRKLRFFTSSLALLAATTLVAGCAAAAPEAPANESQVDLLATHALSGLDGREIVDKLDAMPVADRPADLMASIQPETLLLSDADGNETEVALPADEFYLSVAPYVEQTHDCFFHSLTTCMGELSNEEVEVTVTEQGETTPAFEETMRTFDNGFVGIWLPRDIEGTLIVTNSNGTSSLPVSTDDEAPTCLTTARLI